MRQNPRNHTPRSTSTSPAPPSPVIQAPDSCRVSAEQYWLLAHPQLPHPYLAPGSVIASSHKCFSRHIFLSQSNGFCSSAGPIPAHNSTLSSHTTMAIVTVGLTVAPGSCFAGPTADSASPCDWFLYFFSEILWSLDLQIALYQPGYSNMLSAVSRGGLFYAWLRATLIFVDRDINVFSVKTGLPVAAYFRFSSKIGHSKHGALQS